jgi:glycosyltransferase involved in cell wall biosynthesis
MDESLQNQERVDASPLVTVAMPIYNAGAYLRLAVLSIVKQTYTNWELLLVDDGSTDNALDTITDIRDARIHIYSDGKNKGLAARLNECIDIANGKYIARMDQDDVSYPERFACQIDALEKEPAVDMVAVRALAIDSDGEAVGLMPGIIGPHKKMCAKPWIGFQLPHPTWMGKASWFREYRYTIPGPYYSEDTDLLLRSYGESQFSLVPDILFAYRVRKEIMWEKQFKTRRAVFGNQLKVFSRSHQWGFVCLSVLTLVLRVILDVVRIAKQNVGISGPSLEAPPDSVWKEWRKITKELMVFG